MREAERLRTRPVGGVNRPPPLPSARAGRAARERHPGRQLDRGHLVRGHRPAVYPVLRGLTACRSADEDAAPTALPPSSASAITPPAASATLFLLDPRLFRSAGCLEGHVDAVPPGLKLSASRHDALMRPAIRMRDGPGHRSAGVETAGPASRPEALTAHRVPGDRHGPPGAGRHRDRERAGTRVMRRPDGHAGRVVSPSAARADCSCARRPGNGGRGAEPRHSESREPRCPSRE